MQKPFERVGGSLPPRLEQDVREPADTASEHSSCVRTESGNNADGGDSPPTPRAIVSRVAIQQMLQPRSASSGVNCTGARLESQLAGSSSLDLCAEMDAQGSYCRPPTSSTSMSLADADADGSSDFAPDDDARSEMSLAQRLAETASASGAGHRTCAATATQLKSAYAYEYEHSRSETDLLTRIALSHDCLPTSATTGLHAIELADANSNSSSSSQTQTQMHSAHTDAEPRAHGVELRARRPTRESER